MNKIFLALTLFFCTSVSLADNAELLVNNKVVNSSGEIIKVEQKKKAVMSDFEAYSHSSRKQEQDKQSLAEQQYEQFLKNKRAL